MQDIKNFLVFLLKSPAIWVVIVALLNSNQKWLFPNIPQDVVSSFNNFVAVFSTLVIAYLAGEYNSQQKTKREALRQQTLQIQARQHSLEDAQLLQDKVSVELQGKHQKEVAQ